MKPSDQPYGCKLGVHLFFLPQGVVLPADAARAVALWRRAEAAGDLDAGHNLALDEYSVGDHPKPPQRPQMSTRPARAERRGSYKSGLL